jgi:hypothetical protein
VVQQKFNRFKNNPSIFICAIDVPFPRDTGDIALKLVRKRGHTFPVYIGKKGIDAAFGITSYPTVFLIQHDSIIYKGDIEHVDDVINKRLK